MARKTAGSQISVLIRDLESALRRLRADIRRRANATGLPRSLQAAANQLRKRAAAIAALVEKRAHQVRVEIERGQPKSRTRAKKAKRRVSRPKPAPAAPPPL